MGYPLDIPWMSSPHDNYPFYPTLTSYVRARRLSNAASSLHDDTALWVGAMTFGLLEAITEMKIPESLLVTQEADGQAVISGERLALFIFRWQVYTASRAREHPNPQRGHDIAALLRRALLAVDEEGRKDLSLHARAGFDPKTTQDVICSIVLFLQSLYCYCLACWPQSQELSQLGFEFVNSSRYSYVITTQACQRRMVDAGWCPNTASNELLMVIARPQLSCVVRMKPFIRQSSDEHQRCSQTACVLYTIADTASYRPRHLGSCSCAYTKPPPSAVEDILAKGDIPVVLYEGGRLEVRRAADVPYVAISHVWADGLGSTTEEGLPTCQISRIAALAKALLPESNGAFWMDSVCVPSRPELRKSAIKLMARTYAAATKVLVLDACIRAQCARSKPWEENIMWITMSGWVRRVWTLQEGILARALYFEFADGVVDAADMESYELLDHHLFEAYLPLLQYRSLARRPEGYQHTLDDVIMLLRRRTTTKAEDETIAIAGLLPIDVGKLLNVGGQSSADIATLRMKSLFLQVGELSRRLPVLAVRKLQLANFRWAPSSLANTQDVSARQHGTARCTDAGLRGTYTIGTLEKAVLTPTPDTIGDGSQDAFSFTVVHHPTASVYKGVIGMDPKDLQGSGGPVYFDSLLIVEDTLPADAQFALCAAVCSRSAEDGGEGKSKSEGVDIFCFDFVIPIRLYRLTYDPTEIETGCREKGPHNCRLVRMGELFKTEVLLR